MAFDCGLVVMILDLFIAVNWFVAISVPVLVAACRWL